MNEHDILDVKEYIQTHIKYRYVHISEVGSFMWGQGNENDTVKGLSDHDIMVIYQVPTMDILMGKNIDCNLPCKHDVTINDKLYDFSFMELGHYIKQLMKGNINAIWALTSPLIYYTELGYIQKYVRNNIKAFNILPSGLGMARSQLIDSVKRAEVRSSTKSINAAYRTLKWIEEVYTNGVINYSISGDASYDYCDRFINEWSFKMYQHIDNDSELHNALLRYRLRDMKEEHIEC